MWTSGIVEDFTLGIALVPHCRMLREDSSLSVAVTKYPLTIGAKLSQSIFWNIHFGYIMRFCKKFTIVIQMNDTEASYPALVL